MQLLNVLRPQYTENDMPKLNKADLRGKTKDEVVAMIKLRIAEGGWSDNEIKKAFAWVDKLAFGQRLTDEQMMDRLLADLNAK